MLTIGSHVSFGSNQILGALQEALSYEENTFMFYTGAPTNTVRKDIDADNVKQAQELMKENNIDINNVICHAPYIVNLGSKTDMDKWNFSINFIKGELKRCDEMGITKMVLHPGNAVGITPEEGIANIIEAVNIILDGSTKCKILFETMAGKGTECGRTIDEIAELVKGVKKQDQIAVCLDTCHLFDGGYDLSNFDKYLDEFDSKVGIKFIECVHVNDSKNEQGSHKDRHANIGIGNIGFDNLLNVIYNKRLEDVPKILETPYIGDTDDAKERLYPPYKYEIRMIRAKKFDPEFLKKTREEYKK
jgi:deoxyribonuclease-4